MVTDNYHLCCSRTKPQPEETPQRKRDAESIYDDTSTFAEQQVCDIIYRSPHKTKFGGNEIEHHQNQNQHIELHLSNCLLAEGFYSHRMVSTNLCLVIILL